mmetsp:Transcript_46370/g.68452  ORF Transcript_46370/g.68452 Transcript_46370/m.68452 type:complete len:185 (+) Transcript_46370:88-642(+)
MSPKHEEPRLLHPYLNRIPTTIRFGALGFISNGLFLLGLEFASHHLGESFHASTIYSAFYLCYMPVGHLLTCLLVFGWPKKYLKSFFSTVPIGLTAMTLGSVLTGYLDRIGFDQIADVFVQHKLALLGIDSFNKDEEEIFEYSPVVVMVLTGLWTFVLTNLVMSSGGKGKKAEEEEEEDMKKIL